MDPEGLRQKVSTFFTLNPCCVYSSVQLNVDELRKKKGVSQQLTHCVSCCVEVEDTPFFF